MDLKGQTGNAQPSQDRPAAPSVNPQQPGRGRSSGNRNLIVGIVVAVVVLILATVGYLLWQANSAVGSGAKVEEDKYQAVFMTNGQVYFGRLSNVNDKYAQLTDVYYLQVQQAVQPAEEKKEGEQPQVSLTKLGNELHGPTDKMQVSSQQILFFENLKDDSTVVKAIKDYKNE